MTTRKRRSIRDGRKGDREPVSDIKGWQTVKDAERQSGMSKQRIHILIKQNRIPHREKYRIKLVPLPLPVAKPPS